MWAYGNHYRVENEGGSLGFVTQDYGIASIFGAEEGRSAGVSMVGVLKEIIVVRYSAQRRVVFRGSWIRNDLGPRSSTKIDQYGFTMVRFNDRVARNREPYVLPATVRQVHIVVHVGDCILSMCSPLSQCLAIPAAMKDVMFPKTDSDIWVWWLYRNCRRYSSSKTGVNPGGALSFKRSRDLGGYWITMTNKYWAYREN